MQGVQAHPQKFWFGENPGKIPRTLGKICENLRKIPKNLGKLLENTSKMATNVFSFEKNGGQYGLHEKIFAQKVVQNFFGQVWGKSDKIPLHPQTFACSYTCEVKNLLHSTG